MKYRPEIDGLRAIAVIPVILFHASIDLFSGGFVGVDVFFVISGYLITSIILKDLNQGEFSLVSFFERRARRILPALFLVLVVCTPLAWQILLPQDMQDFTRSVAAVSLFSSNILFWHDAGYWESANALNPMMHTWSLAVEEQFYLLYPVFMMMIWRWRKQSIFRILMLIGLGSLFLAQWSIENAPIANYYLLPTRAWELILGAGIAFLASSQVQPFSRFSQYTLARDAMAGLGIFLIAYSTFTFHENLPFPGILALIPTTGAALIILFATQDTLIGRLLSSRVLVGIGLISYSAYLWHQPILAFYRHLSPDSLSMSELVSLIAATTMIAYFSWRFVEKPFRNGAKLNRESIFKPALACTLTFVAIGIAGHKTYGFVDRSKGDVSFRTLQHKIQNNFGLSNSCEGKSTSSPECQTGNNPEILVWGDSYAVHLVHGIMASNPQAEIIQLTKSACGPFFDAAPIQRELFAESCLKFNGEVQQWVENNPSVKYAVLSSPFTTHLNENNRILLRDGSVKESTVRLIDEEFRKTLSLLEDNGITPVVFSPPPNNNNADIGKCLARAEYFGKNLEKCNFPLSSNSEELKQVHHWLRSLSLDYKVVFLDEFLCPNGICNTFDGDTFVYRDHGHLSNMGSSEFGRRFNFYALIVDN